MLEVIILLTFKDIQSSDLILSLIHPKTGEQNLGMLGSCSLTIPLHSNHHLSQPSVLAEHWDRKNPTLYYHVTSLNLWDVFQFVWFQIVNSLFDGEPMGFDLVALNVQRGRDHGVPGTHSIRSQFRSIYIRLLRSRQLGGLAPVVRLGVPIRCKACKL